MGCGFGQLGHALDGGGAGADDGHPFVRQPLKIAVRAAAGVVVIPTAGVEAVAGKGLKARDARQLGPAQEAVAHHHVARPDRIAAGGVDRPAGGRLVPASLSDFGLKAGAAVQIEAFPDGPAVGENFLRAAVLLLRGVAQFLQQRQVDVGLHIALGAGIAVPVPGAAEVPSLFDYPNVVHPGLLEANAGQQAADPAADDENLHLVVQRLPAEIRVCIGIFEQVAELAPDHHVLVVAVLAYPLVAFLLIPLA